MLTRQSVTKWQAWPFISVHVSRQLDNQPLQWKSIVLIGLYLLYNSPEGNPWWQIISAPVFDWCFDVSALQGHTEELLEALLTESNRAPPHLTPAPEPELSISAVQITGSLSVNAPNLQHRPPSIISLTETQADVFLGRDIWLWRWPSRLEEHTHKRTHTHMPIQAWHNKSCIKYHPTFACLFLDQRKVIAVFHYNLQHPHLHPFFFFFTGLSRVCCKLLRHLCKSCCSVRFQFTVNVSSHFIQVGPAVFPPISAIKVQLRWSQPSPPIYCLWM